MVAPDWEALDEARACIAAVPALRVERANLVAGLIAGGVAPVDISQALGVNRQRVSQLAANAADPAAGPIDVLWDRLAELAAFLVDARGCYERQRAAVRTLVDGGVARQEIAHRAGVTVGSIAYLLGEIDRRSRKASA